jgi:bifunctional non-homologous end joining protein LigD
MRVNRGQEFVIGGYTATPRNFDALVFGYFEGDRLIYVARTRNGFTPSLRQQLFRRFHKLEIKTCPFANLPERYFPIRLRCISLWKLFWAARGGQKKPINIAKRNSPAMQCR